MAAGFIVTDGAELYALLKALLEAKFHPDPDSPEVQGSPLVAGLCERAVEAVAAWEEAHAQPGKAEQTRAWFREASGNLALTAVRRRIAECISRGVWSQWSAEQRAEYVRILLSPYRGNEDLVRGLLESIVGLDV